jgi:hypothetical protein
MRIPRSAAIAFFLALALVLGQHAGLLHGLTHATEQMHSKGAPAKVACDQCFACSQLSGVAPSVHVPPADAADTARHAIRGLLKHLPAERVAFHSRAPPALS